VQLSAGQQRLGTALGAFDLSLESRRGKQSSALVDPANRSAGEDRTEPIRNGDVSRRSDPKIVFFGHFGAGNLGNEATLQAALHNLRRLVPDADFVCICTGPETVASAYNITAVPSRRFIVKPWSLQNPLARLARKLVIGIPSELYRWLKGFNTLRGAKALIIPGTGLLNDVATLFNWGAYDIFRWSVTARLCGCKVFFVSVGAGPLYSRAGRFFVKASLSLANFRSYRDESSLEYLKRVGFRSDNDAVYPDLVFSFLDTPTPDALDGQEGRMVVGLGLMDDARNYSVERPASFTHEAYLKRLAEFARWVLAQGHDVRLLIGSGEDTPVVEQFKLMLKAGSVRYRGRIIDEPVASVQDLLSQIAATNCVIATRFHNVLLSLLLNKPVIAISFHHKCSSLMSQMGLSEYCQDINHLNVDRLIAQFRDLETNAETLKARIKHKTQESRRALDEQYNHIFREILPSRHIISPRT
jgi:polysaccharide pyruvyl transferase WcaK-like protein